MIKTLSTIAMVMLGSMVMTSKTMATIIDDIDTVIQNQIGRKQRIDNFQKRFTEESYLVQAHQVAHGVNRSCGGMSLLCQDGKCVLQQSQKLVLSLKDQSDKFIEEYQRYEPYISDLMVLRKKMEENLMLVQEHQRGYGANRSCGGASLLCQSGKCLLHTQQNNALQLENQAIQNLEKIGYYRG